MNLTPHGPGFSFLDSLEIVEPRRRARGLKWLDPKSAFFADHFPGDPRMPGVLLVECAAQAAGAFWIQSQGGTTPALAFLGGVQQFRFLKPVRPGETVEIEVLLEKDFQTMALFEATLRVGGTVVAQGKLSLSLQK